MINQTLAVMYLTYSKNKNGPEKVTNNLYPSWNHLGGWYYIGASDVSSRVEQKVLKGYNRYRHMIQEWSEMDTLIHGLSSELWKTCWTMYKALFLLPEPVYLTQGLLCGPCEVTKEGQWQHVSFCNSYSMFAQNIKIWESLFTSFDWYLEFICAFQVVTDP